MQVRNDPEKRLLTIQYILQITIVQKANKLTWGKFLSRMTRADTFERTRAVLKVGKRTLKTMVLTIHSSNPAYCVSRLWSPCIVHWHDVYPKSTVLARLASTVRCVSTAISGITGSNVSILSFYRYYCVLPLIIPTGAATLCNANCYCIQSWRTCFKS